MSQLAEKIKFELSPACTRIEIAGSIRRQKKYVGDIEIVAIPKMRPDIGAQLSLLGDPPQAVSALDILLNHMVANKENFRRGDKDGQLHKNFLIEYDEDGSEVCLDLFITSHNQWGYIYALRTGPGEYNRAWVTQESKGGLLSDSVRCIGGWLVGADGKGINTPEERDVFKWVEGGFIPATDRDQWRKYCEVPRPDLGAKLGC